MTFDNSTASVAMDTTTPADDVMPTGRHRTTWSNTVHHRPYNNK